MFKSKEKKQSFQSVENRQGTVQNLSSTSQIDYKSRGQQFSNLVKFRTFLRTCFSEEARFGHSFFVIPVAMIAGAYFNFSRHNDIPYLAIIIPIIAIALAYLTIPSLGQKAKLVCVTFMAFLAGIMAANIELNRRPILLDQDVTTSVKGVVLSSHKDEAGISRYIISLKSTSSPTIKRKPEQVQLVARTRHKSFQVGDMIAGKARLTSPSGPVFPGGFDFAFSAMTKNIGAYGFFLGAPEKVMRPDMPSVSFLRGAELTINKVRSNISDRIQWAIKGDAAGIAAALIVSERRLISNATVEALRNAGLSHVLAISGLHMVLAAGTIFVSLRFIFSIYPTAVQAFAIKKIAAFGAIITASLYLAISGAPISAQRAWLMLSIALCAVMLDRSALTLRNVALAAIVIVLITPSAVLTPGFQMSFAAASALVSVYTSWSRLTENEADLGSLSPIFNGLHSILRFILGLTVTAIIAGFATGIFSIQHFYQISSYGVLGNVLAMPIVTFLVMPLALLSLLAMPYGLETWPLLALGQSIDWVIAIAYWVSDLDGDIIIGKPLKIVSILLTTGFLIFICFRSVLRFVGVAIMGMAALSASIFAPIIPDILISEDGRLIGVRDKQELSLNRARPSDFVIKQWDSAYGLSHRLSDRALNKRDSQKLLALDNQEFWRQYASQTNYENDKNFHCLNSNFCMFDNGELRILTIGKPEYLNKACQNFDIVVLSFRLRSNQFPCDKSPDQIIDQNSLRRTGAMAAYLKDASTAREGISMTIETAIDGHIRPWTIQRYYDWRDRNYHLPNNRLMPNEIKTTTKISDSAE